MAQHFVRPDVQAFLRKLADLNQPKGWEVGAIAARRMMVSSRHAFEVPIADIAVREDIEGPVPLRLYDPRNERSAGPIVLFFHGGGWVIGDLESHDPFCTDVANGLDVPVVAVDYRLAPEYPFPAAFEDALATARWVACPPAALGRTPTSLVLAGDSAGGNLAAGVAAALRDQPAPVPVVAQWLIYPAADPCVHYKSYDEYNEGYVLTKKSMDWFEDCYAGPRCDWRYSPLLAGTAGLPATMIVTAGLDPLRDQGRAYAARCIEQGVETIYMEAQGTVHGFLNLRKAIPSGQEDFVRCLSHLKTWLDRLK